MSSSTGQASSDYVALLCVAAIALSGGVALAVPDIPRAIVANARVALCIVGGDVCRASDAERAGLEPCVTRVDEGTRRTAATILMFRVGSDRTLAVEERSDGSFSVALADSHELAGTAGASVHLGPIDVQASVGGGERWRSGRTWELHDRAAVAKLIAALHGRRSRHPAATYRYLAGGQFLDGGASAGPVQGSGSAEHWLGRRVGRGTTTWYRDVSAQASAAFGELIPDARSARAQSWVLEATRDERGLRSLVFRGTLARTAGETVEIRAALDLSDPGNRAAARDLLSLEDGRGLLPALFAMRHRLAPGAIERAVYRISEQESGRQFGGGPPGREVGLERRTRSVRRELVAADVLHPGGRRARRADCAGIPA